jgi:glyoxylase-like metal-dependent hydrolase (beta-lactamase superfamily II)
MLKALKWIFVFVLLVGCAPQVEAQPISLPVDPKTYVEITPDLKARHIQEGVFVITHSFPWDANSLAVVMGDHLMLVDTPWTPQATEAMLTWLEAQVGSKEVVAINTHFHLDNLGGNQFLVGRDIPVYGSDLTVELLAERGRASLDQTVQWLQAEGDPRFAQTLASLELIPPREVFDIHEGLQLEFGDQSLEVYYPGPAHSPDNLVVYFPEHKILFGGCMIIGWDQIGNTADADLAAWPASVRQLKQFDFDVLIPGHGARLDPGLLTHTLALLKSDF